MRKLLLILFASLIWVGASGQHRDTLKYPDSYLDTVNVDKVFVINDYFTVGVEYGVAWNDFLFNPTYKTERQFNPGYMGVFLTHHEKMFGFMPYFGFKVGIAKGKEGFMFKMDKETGKISVLYSARELGLEEAEPEIGQMMDVIEAPFMLMAHMDTPYFKLLGEAGIYGGYRMNVERFGIGGTVPNDQFDFKPFEKRFDYGLQGGAGFGLVFSPFEFTLNLRVRYSWGSLFEPDWYSKYYYRFAYPLDFMVTGGVYLQLGRRSGKSRAAIKHEAYNFVYGN